jgi:predicted secreted protein
LLDNLPITVENINRLSIRVALPQDNYPSQEQMLIGLAQVMNRMKQFKDLCAQEKLRTGREITWRWHRVGILESIGNLGLNNDENGLDGPNED